MHEQKVLVTVSHRSTMWTLVDDIEPPLSALIPEGDLFDDWDASSDTLAAPSPPTKIIRKRAA